MKQLIYVLVICGVFTTMASAMKPVSSNETQDDGVAKGGGCFGACYKKSLEKNVPSQATITPELELEKQVPTKVQLSTATIGLFWAVLNDNSPYIVKHIKAGAEVNAKDRYGCTPLHYAATRKTLDCAILLLSFKGIDKHCATDDGHTVLEIIKLRRQTTAGQDKNDCDRLIEYLTLAEPPTGGLFDIDDN